MGESEKNLRDKRKSRRKGSMNAYTLVVGLDGMMHAEDVTFQAFDDDDNVVNHMRWHVQKKL